jgi:hypothetical protein
VSGWNAVRLAPKHQLEHFDSGELDLDSWLRNQARAAQRRNTAQTFVWPDCDTERVVGYYSLVASTLRKDELTSRLNGNVDVSPAFLLARLALDRSIQGGRGGELLYDALNSMVTAADIVAARLIVVDALSERAARFYEQGGFDRLALKGVPSLRLVMKMATAREAVRSDTLDSKEDQESDPG